MIYIFNVAEVTVKMDNLQKNFNPDNPQDADALMQMAFESDDDQNNFELPNESDIDSEDFTEERDEQSDTVEEAISETDVTDENDTATDCYIGKDKFTKWKKTMYPNRIKRRPQNIWVRLPGVIGPARNANSILECWKCLISDEIIEIICLYTNQYIETIRAQYVRERDAKFTDISELRAFIGLLYLAGVFHSNRQSLEELWGTDGYGIEIFRIVMSIKRFKFLMRCIRFDDKTTRQERRKYDKLAAVRNIFTKFNDNCKKNYSPGQSVTIDEMLAGFRGRCPFKQYIPSKPNKYGIKLFLLVDAKVWYTHNLEIYPGKQPEGPFSISYKPVDVVKRLTEPIYNTGRNVTADNWFTDVELVSFLQSKKLSYVGTVKKNKRQLPLDFVATKKDQKDPVYLAFKKMQRYYHMFRRRARMLF